MSFLILIIHYRIRVLPVKAREDFVGAVMKQCPAIRTYIATITSEVLPFLQARPEVGIRTLENFMFMQGEFDNEGVTLSTLLQKAT